MNQLLFLQVLVPDPEDVYPGPLENLSTDYFTITPIPVNSAKVAILHHKKGKGAIIKNKKDRAASPLAHPFPPSPHPR